MSERVFKSNKYIQFKDFMQMCCHLSDFFVKQMQLIFLLYIIIFDSDIAYFTETIATTDIPYLTRIIVNVMMAFVFIISAQDFIKIQKKLTIYLKSRKYGTKIKIPTAFTSYYKKAALEIITMICILALTLIIYFTQGTSTKEFVLIWYEGITYFYYLLIHAIHGFIVKYDRATLRQRELEKNQKILVVTFR